MDGTLDYSKYGDEDLLQVLNSIDPNRAPLNFAHLRTELEARGYVLATTVTGRHVATRVAGAPVTNSAAPRIHSFAVRLNAHSLRLAWYEPAWNDFRLIGNGRVEVSEAYLHVSALRFTLLGIPFKRRIELKLDRIRNLEIEDSVVAFEYYDVQSKPKRLTLYFDDRDAAEQFGVLLSAERTADFNPKLAEHVEFEMSLHARAPRAPVTLTLIAANVLMFLVALFNGAPLLRGDSPVFIALGSNFGPLTSDGEWWRLCSALFLHLNLSHLVFNLWALLSIGPTVERLLGSISYALLYVATGICASITSVLWNPAVNSIGASGAILGVCGALIAVLTRRHHPIPQTVRTPLLLSIGIFTCYAVGFGFLSTRVDNAAHLGGLASGFILGALLARPLAAQQDSAASGGIRFASAVTLSLAAIFIGAIGVKFASRSLTGEPLLWHTQHWFARNERISLQHRAMLWERASKREISDADFADELEARVLEFWRRAETRFTAITLPPNSTAQPELDRLIEISKVRRNAFELCVEGLRKSSMEIFQRCQAELGSGDQLIDSARRQPANRT